MVRPVKPVLFWPSPACREALRLAAAAEIIGGAVGAAGGPKGATGTAEDIYGEAEGFAEDIIVSTGATAAVVVTVGVERATVDMKEGTENWEDKEADTEGGGAEAGSLEARAVTWSCRRRI